MRPRVCSVLIALAMLNAACQRQDAPPAAANANPAIQASVGPLPGPGDYHARTVTNPYGANRVALLEGRKLFMAMNCAGCHGDHAGGGMGPSLRDEDWIYGNADAQIFATIAEGRAHGMPSWGTRLSGDQIWKLVAYIKSMRKPYEPDSPQP